MHAPNEGAGWERLFRLVFEQTSNPIVLLDEQRQIIEINDAALSLFGGDRQDVLGGSMADSVRPEERALAASEWEAFLRSGEYSGRRTLIRANGSEVQIDFAARLGVIEGRRLAIYVAVTDDASLTGSAISKGELPLTKREREVVTLIALGRETDQILHGASMNG